ncbi:hypothetical protein [Mucilaginibacter pedocola]|uniref:Uncharacterized protein n=1 Tax=Mucilaginibacter pedocola TaxID=1792845 RepID=A0A1S9PHI9_9SPHI|nr:hypothetical protein [Mucilaginibacter pedocola]OOQ60395.1 hypothetical protein BC343_25590 [Mucilaginibacter pedocola]
MKAEFDLMISFRTPDGFKQCGQYFLGHDREFADSVFKRLAGDEDIMDSAVLHIDLVETSGSLPANIVTIGCKLSELSANCELVTRELFRKHAIREDET